VLGLYDISKTQKLMAENKTDKEISERIYDLCKHCLKELAEYYQIVDNSFQNIINDMKELNMPHKPNPFQNWHDVSLKVDKNEHIEIPGATSPKVVMKYLKVHKLSKTKLVKTGIFTNRMKNMI